MKRIKSQAPSQLPDAFFFEPVFVREAPFSAVVSRDRELQTRRLLLRSGAARAKLLRLPMELVLLKLLFKLLRLPMTLVGLMLSKLLILHLPKLLLLLLPALRKSML